MNKKYTKHNIETIVPPQAPEMRKSYRNHAKSMIKQWKIIVLSYFWHEKTPKTKKNTKSRPHMRPDA